MYITLQREGGVAMWQETGLCKGIAWAGTGVRLYQVGDLGLRRLVGEVSSCVCTCVAVDPQSRMLALVCFPVTSSQAVDLSLRDKTSPGR